VPDRASDPVTVLLKRLPGTEDLLPPARMTAEAAGFDLRAAVPAPVVLAPGDVRVIPCGFAMAIPAGYEAQVRPRSGLAARHGVTLVNSPGTIDSDYRGEVMVPLINHGREPFTVDRGMRVAQMLVLPVPPIRLVEVDELDATSRGTGGFGHTGR
jgi:dUTP pyrophosphatase